MNDNIKSIWLGWKMKKKNIHTHQKREKERENEMKQLHMQSPRNPVAKSGEQFCFLLFEVKNVRAIVISVQYTCVLLNIEDRDKKNVYKNRLVWIDKKKPYTVDVNVCVYWQCVTKISLYLVMQTHIFLLFSLKVRHCSGSLFVIFM